MGVCGGCDGKRGRRGGWAGRLAGAVAPAFLLALALAAAWGGARAEDRPSICGADGVCRISVEADGEVLERTYRVRAPSGWDGVTPLPVVIHFHGWRRSARFVMNNSRQTGPAERAGVLLAAPDSIGPTWRFRTAESRDVAMADALIADLERRAPIRRDQVLVSGFSHGGSMVWRLACDRGGAFAGYTPIAGRIGGFDGGDCAGGPARVLQVHGTRDNVLPPPTGRPEDPADDFLAWRAPGACAAEPDERVTVGRFACRHWRRCRPGAYAGLCLLDTFHANPRNWLDYAIPTLLAEAADAAEPSPE